MQHAYVVYTKSVIAQVKFCKCIMAMHTFQSAGGLIRWNLGIRDTQGTVKKHPEFWGVLSSKSISLYWIGLWTWWRSFQVVPISQVVLKIGVAVETNVVYNGRWDQGGAVVARGRKYMSSSICIICSHPDWIRHSLSVQDPSANTDVCVIISRIEHFDTAWRLMLIPEINNFWKKEITR